MNNKNIFEKILASKMMPAFLFVLSFLIFCLRNMDPVLYPTLYAEDGVWTIKMITAGFQETVFDTRVFPILGFVLFYKIGGFFVDLIFSSDIRYLPLAYYVLSNLFLSALVISTFNLIKKTLYPLAIFSVVVMLLLLPVGSSSNEIYGRVLNLGFIFPFFQIVLLAQLFLKKLSKLKVFSITLFSMVSCLTFPIGLGINLSTALLLLVYGVKNKETKYYTGVSLALFAAVLACFLTLSASTFSSKGGANLPVELGSFIEFAIARAAIYPIIFSFYSHLNDTLTLIFFVCILGLVIRVLIQKYRSDSSDATLFLLMNLWAGFLVYLIATVTMRIGLSSLFSDYSSTFPDRYFTGLNLLFILAFIFTLSLSKHKNLARFLIVLIVLPVLLSINETIELGNPKMRFDSSDPWTTSICSEGKREVGGRTLSFNIPPEGWSVSVNEEKMHLIKRNCDFSPFYNIAPLTHFYMPILSLNAGPDNLNFFTPSLVQAHDVNIIKNDDHSNKVYVIGSDPIVLLPLEKAKRINESKRFNISIEIASKVDGEMQFFYKTKATEKFKEEKSIKLSIRKGVNYIYLNVSSDLPDDGLRVDFPDKIISDYRVLTKVYGTKKIKDSGPS